MKKFDKKDMEDLELSPKLIKRWLKSLSKRERKDAIEVVEGMIEENKRYSK